LIFLLLIQGLSLCGMACLETACDPFQENSHYPAVIKAQGQADAPNHNCCPDDRCDAGGIAQGLPCRGWMNALSFYAAPAAKSFRPPDLLRKSGSVFLHTDLSPQIPIFVLNQTFLC